MESYLKRLVQAHYLALRDKGMVPSSLQNREFAFIFWDKKGMTRHVGFLNKSEFFTFITSRVPRHIYYSAALYSQPWKDNMTEKEWTGCDLIFDIDCDHIETPCKNDHDSWTCKSCGHEEKGQSPQSCPECNGNKFEKMNWVCDRCLERAKIETKKLVDGFLISDLGIEPSSLKIYFSGNRGYHVHLEEEAFRRLSSYERREIADYITGTGISLVNIGLNFNSNNFIGFKLGEPGWRGKIAMNLKRLVERLISPMNFKKSLKFESPTDSGYELEDMNLDAKIRNLLIENGHDILTRLENGSDNWVFKGIGAKNWEKIINHIINQAKSNIDVAVTIDIHRLIRMPGSLHGKTGFEVRELTRRGLDYFDPFSDPVVFKDNIEKIKILGNVPRFRIEQDMYGPYEKDDVVKMSIGAAVFLLCKKLGVVI
ncbi:MAG: DNA primase small subunit domain-containing protein [Promethearchaeota archaeon]